MSRHSSAHPAEREPKGREYHRICQLRDSAFVGRIVGKVGVAHLQTKPAKSPYLQKYVHVGGCSPSRPSARSVDRGSAHARTVFDLRAQGVRSVRPLLARTSTAEPWHVLRR